MKSSTRLFALLTAVSVLACGGPEASGDEAGSSAEETAEGWWFEVDVAGLDIPRVTGSRVGDVAVGSMHTVRASTGSSHLTFTYNGTEPGTYPANAFRARNGDEHVCAVEGTVEVESVEPLVATLTGDAQCWAGTSYGPEDPNNPGRALAPATGTLTASIRQ